MRSIIVLLALAGAACSSAPEGPEAGQLRVTPLSGEVSLLEGGESTLLDEPTTVDQGVSIVTEIGGRARIDFAGERTMELAPETQLRVGPSISEVARGSVLVETSTGARLAAGGSEMEAGEGTFRIDKSPDSSSIVLATFSGAVSVVGSNVPPVPALRQATVLPGGVISAPGIVPLEVSPNDPWDAELLGSAIDLGLQLLTFERGLARQLPSGREATAVSRMLERDFSPRAIGDAIDQLGNAASAVVAAVVAQEAARLDGGSASRILNQILGLESFGAHWIVIVAEWGLPAAAEALIARLRELADSISQVVTPPPAPALASVTPGSTSSGGASGAPNGGSSSSGGTGNSPGGDQGGGSPPPGGSTTTQPPDPPPAEENPQESSQPPPPPPQPCANPVDCTVTDILDDPPRSDLPIG